MSIKILLASTLIVATLSAQNLQTTQEKYKNTITNSNQTQAATITQKSPKHKLTIAQATLLAINSVRAKPQICSQATTPLRWNDSLYQVTKEHSVDMAITGKLSHNGSGTNSDKTAKNLGLSRGSFFYERVNQKENSKKILSAELVIRTNKESYKSPKDLINYWILKPQNCKILMDSRFTDIAMSKVISNRDNKSYWTLMLAGTRKSKQKESK